MTGIDEDGDGVDGAIDPDDWNANRTGVDNDGDGVDAAVDPNDNNVNVTGIDEDGDGVDGAIDPDDWDADITPDDIDGDGIDNNVDSDVDGDGIDNNTDTDDDGDGVPDTYDTSPLDSSLPDFYEDFSSGGFSNPPKGTAWDVDDNVVVRTSFGLNNVGASIIAVDGNSNNNFAVIHTGIGNSADVGELKKQFNFVGDGYRQITFDYNFVTTEYLARDTSTFNDYFTAELHLSDGSTVQLAHEDANTSTFSSVTGLPLSLVDFVTGGETGWISVDLNVWVLDGLTELHFHVNDVGSDGTHDSAVLLDNVVDPPVTTSSTDYLLTFARMLRGDVDVHDADLEADAVANAEHQAFIARVNEVISDLENSSESEFMAGKDEFFDRLWIARDTLANHEDTTEFLQETGIAHHLLEASIMTDQGISTTNITAIADSVNQAKTFLVAHINDFGETDALANIKTNIDSVLANIENVNNNEFTTATLVAIRDGIKKTFSDTIDHMNGVGHECITGNHVECEQPL